MILFLNHMKRMLKNKTQLIVMLILPLLPVVPIALGTPASEQMVIVGISDEDQTPLTAAFMDTMKSNCKVIDVKKEGIENAFLNATIHYALIIEKGFTETMINTGESKIAGYAKAESDFTPLIQSYVESFMNPVKNISAASGGNSDTFYSGMKAFNEGTLKVSNEIVEKPDTGKANAAWGMMIQFMMFSTVFSSTLLIVDKENKTFFRTLSASVRMKSYMLQSIMSFLAIAILQIIVLLAVTVGGLGIYPGVTVLNMFALLAVFSLVSVSMGIAITSFCKNTMQASISGATIVVLMCLMGGAWGKLPSSGIVTNLSKLLPVTWAIESVDQLTQNGSLASIAGNLGILVLFAVVFFLLGTWRKADVAK